MLFAFFVLAALTDLVPARWPSSDVTSLDLVRATPVNCLLIEERHWSRPFADQAAKLGITALAVLRPSGDPPASVRRAIELGFRGAVLEGVFDPQVRDRLREALAAAGLDAIELPPRAQIRFDGKDGVIGTAQGVWPGVQASADGATKAAPSGAAWIDTNTGFLRFARASTKAAIWIANTPPPDVAYPVQRYLEAIGDAAMAGARWVVSLDDNMFRKLLTRDRAAASGWSQIADVLRFYEEHKEWRDGEPFARLALVEGANSGALLSGGILDMIAVKHTPVRPVPQTRLDAAQIAAAKMAVNVDPDALSSQQKEILKAFTRAGGTLLTGPPGWKFPAPRPGQITLEKDDLNKLDEIWKELNSLTGRKNLGARLFNVSTMLSNLLESSDHMQVFLHLVNYSDYPVDNVTVHVLGKYRSAVVLQPGSRPVALSSYEVEDGTGLDVDQVRSVATLVLTR